MEFQRSTIHQLIHLFSRGFRNLGVEVPLKKLEQLAVVIHGIMLGPSRNFHTVQHIMNLCDPDDPITHFAAMFHDLVYVQVDQGFSKEIDTILSPFIQRDGRSIRIKAGIGSDHTRFWLAMKIFGFHEGQVLSPLDGLNEFLSALVCLIMLEDLLGLENLVRITVCIEATIPFRGDPNPFDVLEGRLRKLEEHFPVKFSVEQRMKILHTAVNFSNRDVGNFGHTDPGVFLDDTWKLLPELNSALRDKDLYSVKDYRVALARMDGFFSQLDASRVFHRYKGIPPKERWEEINHYAQKNIDIARQYIGVKLLSIAVIEALANATGGDAPISLFLGELEGDGEKPIRFEDFLPEIPLNPVKDVSENIFQLLKGGRLGESSFDIKESPIGTFIYQGLGDQRSQELIGDAKKMFAGQLSPLDFLHRIDPEVLNPLITATASMVFTRRDDLLKLKG